MHQIHRDVVKSFVYLSLIIELSKNRTVSGYDVMVLMRSFGLKVSPGTIYYQIKRLEKARVIERLKDPSTKETKIYKITGEGLKAFKKFKDEWKHPIRYLCQSIAT